ncbi:MAG TPA: protein translocase subunit SecD [Anaerolineales bacterium]|nr:protein translocase subunit SecD [Anaerolineales bacterium]
MEKYRRWLIPILLLTAFSAWIVWPNNPGIHIHWGNINYDRPLDFHLGLDLRGGVQALLEADMPCDQVDPEAMTTARVIVEKRVNALGVSEAVVQLAENCRIVVEIPGETDPERALSTIRKTGVLEFVALGKEYLPPGTVVQTDLGGTATPATPTPTAPPQATLTGEATALPSPTPQPKVYHTVMTGAALKSVTVQADQVGKGYQIAFVLTDEGAKIFGDFTSKHVGEYLGIALDKTIISAPVVREPITDGRGVISGNFTYESANDLAIQLRYGSLPIPLKVAESRTIGPTLGEDSLQRSLVAGLIGLGIVLLFMALYYRLPGLVADIALFTYALFSLALFKWIPVTLTLPGIAAFILSIGMAVDANILIFERMKEELRAGHALINAIDLGWHRAWPSIRDANISTLITTAILYWFGNAYGASLVKGFAFTLALGVGVSLFTAITVTRVYLHTLLDRIKFAEHPKWFGI